MAASPVVLLLLLLHSGAALEIRGPSTHQATVGSASLIPCYYTVEKPPVDPNFFAAFWHFQGKEILSYDHEVKTTDARYSLNTEKALNGEVDLSISEIFLSDAGVYTCTVIYSPERRQKDITVHITVQTARPQIVITDNVTIDEKSVLRCSVTGFYPVDIDIEWFRGSEQMTDVTIEEPWRNSDGTYNVNSMAVITPTDEDRERIFSCRVRHESLQEPLQEDFQLTYRDKNVMSQTEILFIIVPVLGFLIIAIIVYFIYKKIRTRPDRQIGEIRESEVTSGTPHPKSSGIPLTSPNTSTSGGDRSTGSPPVTGTPPDLQVGEITVPDELILNRKATLECRLHHYDTGIHNIRWYEKKSEIEEPIPVNDKRRLQTTERESNDGRTWKAYLVLTPVKWSDDGTEYIFRVKASRFGEMIERSTGNLSVTGKTPSSKYKSPEKDQAEEYDQRQTPHEETVEERHIQEPRKEGREGLCPVNESIHEEEKQKMPTPDHNVEKESDDLGECDNSEGTRKSGNLRAVCPADEEPGEERTGGPSLPTNKLSHGKKTDDLEERSTSEDEEELDQQKEKEETSPLVNKPINEEETDKSEEGSTLKEDDDLYKKSGGLLLINEPPREEKGETSQEGKVWREDSRGLGSAQVSSSEEEDDEETSLMNTKLDTGIDKSE